MTATAVKADAQYDAQYDVPPGTGLPKAFSGRGFESYRAAINDLKEQLI